MWSSVIHKDSQQFHFQPYIKHNVTCPYIWFQYLLTFQPAFAFKRMLKSALDEN